MKQKINWAVTAMALALAIAGLAVGIAGWARPMPEPADTSALEERIAALEAQVSDLEIRLEAALLTEGLADWSLLAEPWPDSTGADVRLEAVPADASREMAASLSVRLEGREVANVPCQHTGDGFSATVSLAAADGYSYYCILTGADGSRQQIVLSTPENPVAELPVYLETSLACYCNMVVEGWTQTSGALVLTGAYIQVQLPRLTPAESLFVADSALVLSCGDRQIQRIVLDLPAGEGENSYEQTVADLALELPVLTEGQQLSLTLEVTLSDGRVLTAPAADWYRDADGLYLVVG